MSENNGKIRLQAFLASCGFGSRRSCEKLILDGRVTINGMTATLGQSVNPQDLVHFDGKIAKPQARLRYLALNKPPGFVTSMSDERGRPVASSLLGNSVEERGVQYWAPRPMVIGTLAFYERWGANRSYGSS